MIRWFSFSILAGLLLMPLVAVRAQESTEDDAQDLTQPERLALQLAESKVPSDRALGKRWDRLIRRRQWVDSTGKHKIHAKYLEHDPDLTWVKLLVLVKKGVKKGEEQSEKVLQVELKRLDKKDQALVKRIALARRQVLATLPAPGSENDGSRTRPPSRRREAPPAEDIAEDFEESPEEEVDYSYYADYARRASGRAAVEEANEKPKPTLDHNTPDLPDKAAWRSSYEIFIGNLSSERIDSEGDELDMTSWQLDWGDLQDIRYVWEAMSAMTRAREGRITQEEAFAAQHRAAEARPRVGEVLWEAKLLKPIGAPGGEIAFDLPKPPQPFAVRFRLDKKDPGAWQTLQPGDRVRFIGRIQPYSPETPIVTLEVRFPDEQPGDTATDESSGP